MTPSGRKCVSSLIIRRHLVLNVADQGNAHLCRVVTTKNIARELSLDLHLNLEWIN